MAVGTSGKRHVKTGAHGSSHFSIFSVEHKARSSEKVRMGKAVLNV